ARDAVPDSASSFVSPPLSHSHRSPASTAQSLSATRHALSTWASLQIRSVAQSAIAPAPAIRLLPISINPWPDFSNAGDSDVPEVSAAIQTARNFLDWTDGSA